MMSAPRYTWSEVSSKIQRVERASKPGSNDSDKLDMATVTGPSTMCCECIQVLRCLPYDTSRVPTVTVRLTVSMARSNEEWATLIASKITSVQADNSELSIPVPSNLAPYIDHTLLKPDATAADIDKLCDEAIKYKFKVCLRQYRVPLTFKRTKLVVLHQRG